MRAIAFDLTTSQLVITPEKIASSDSFFRLPVRVLVKR